MSYLFGQMCYSPAPEGTRPYIIQFEIIWNSLQFEFFDNSHSGLHYDPNGV